MMYCIVVVVDDDDWYKVHSYHYLFEHRNLHWMLAVVVVDRQLNDDDEEQPMDDWVEELQMEVWVNDDEAKNV
jgi:hypothetical protein